MKIKLGISARHIHLTEEDYNLLFNEPMNIIKPINQPGQYASDKQVTLINKDKKLERVRVVGPSRPYTQVEVSRTDAYNLGLNPPVKLSGDLKEAEEITIKTDKGEIKRKAALIMARHIHITPEERKKRKLTKDVYQVRIPGEKGGILDNVFIVEKENSYYEMHIDTDEANAFLAKENEEVEILD